MRPLQANRCQATCSLVVMCKAAVQGMLRCYNPHQVRLSHQFILTPCETGSLRWRFLNFITGCSGKEVWQGAKSENNHEQIPKVAAQLQGLQMGLLAAQR